MIDTASASDERKRSSGASSTPCWATARRPLPAPGAAGLLRRGATPALRQLRQLPVPVDRPGTARSPRRRRCRRGTAPASASAPRTWSTCCWRRHRQGAAVRPRPAADLRRRRRPRREAVAQRVPAAGRRRPAGGRRRGLRRLRLAARRVQPGAAPDPPARRRRATASAPPGPRRVRLADCRRRPWPVRALRAWRAEAGARPERARLRDLPRRHAARDRRGRAAATTRWPASAASATASWSATATTCSSSKRRRERGRVRGLRKRIAGDRSLVVGRDGFDVMDSNHRPAD
jgi:hypothetical protein